MRTFLVLICTVALACAAGGAQNENQSKKSTTKKKQVQSSQPATAASRAKKATPTHYQAAKATHYQKPKAAQHVTTAGGRSTAIGANKTKDKPKGSQQIATQSGQPAGGKLQKTKGSQQAAVAGKYTASSTYSQKTKQLKGRTTSAAAFQSSSGIYKAKHFDLQTRTRPATVGAVTFQQNRRIHGSQNWQGQNYWAFRNYRPVWHERSWWNRHYNRVVFVYGGWYYWNAGWWYPAWGYAPNAYYAYDGPIYAYNGLPPDQAIANVQSALQQQGYYQGEVDGLLGPLTRAAIANYQRDHGLYITSAIDRPTLESLGMT